MVLRRRVWYHHPMERLDDHAIAARLAGLGGWEHDDGALRRTFRFPSFRSAIEFVVQVADLAEEADHHPELTNVYDRVDVVLTTHDSGGVTERDVGLARRIDSLV